MQTKQRQKTSTETLVLGAILTALVVVLQMMGSFIRFGMFSISLVLVPIVIGAHDNSFSVVTAFDQFFSFVSWQFQSVFIFFVVFLSIYFFSAKHQFNFFTCYFNVCF